jgi:hypothetical protein
MAHQILRNKKLVPRFGREVASLGADGVKALLPSTYAKDQVTTHWTSPAISARKAAIMRKQAVRDGSYGTFNSETGQGWLAQWDIDVALQKPRGQGRHRTRVPKKTKRMRTREERARKIEEKMVGMEERVEKMWWDRVSVKEVETFETMYKRLSSAVKGPPPKK